MNLKFYALISILLFSTVMTPIVAHAENDLAVLLEEEDDDYIEKLLAYLVSQGKSMDSIKAEFLRDESIEKPNNVLAKNKSKIGKLEKRMDKLTREFKRTKIKIAERPERPLKFNRFFCGDPNLATDASLMEIDVYHDAFANLQRLIKEQEEKFPGLKTGQLSSFNDCLELINDLFHYHTHNRQIGQEAYWTGKSPTYYNLERNRAAIHWDNTGDANPYQLRATLIFTIFERAYRLAVENDMLPEMFNFLSKSSGCLEARINRLNDWWEQKSAVLEKRKLLKAASPYRQTALNNILDESAEIAVYRHIEELGEDITNLIEREGKEGVARLIVERFQNKVGADGKAITLRLVRNCLTITLLTPVTTPERNYIRPARSPRDTPSRKRLSFEDQAQQNNPDIEQIENLAIQVARIRRIELPNGNVAFNAQLHRVAPNGNCGMVAVGTDRETFIQEVVAAYLDPNLSFELRQFIQQAIAHLHLQPGDIYGWARAFNSPGQWMEDFHFEIFARIHHRRIEVFGVDQHNTTFYYLRTFGVTEEGEPIRIINRPLLPTHHEEARPLNGNHFDALVLTDAPQAGFPLELPGVTAVVGALTMGFASMTITKIAKK